MIGNRQTLVLRERRYGIAGTEILDRLRRAKAARGRIATEDVEQIASDFQLPRAHVHAAASYYADLGFEPQSERHIRVCAGTSCYAATGGRHIDELKARLGATEPSAATDAAVTVEPVYCLGYCYAGPAALDGETPHAGVDLVEQLAGDAARQDPEIPVASEVGDPVLLAGILGTGPQAWSVWPQAVGADGRRIADEVLKAGLRGRGGAGFPAARKWIVAAESPSDGPRYVICNADEGDPGSYIDRLLMERDPHRVLEGVALAALAVGASHAYMYVRSEYPRARDILREAVAEARRQGHLGEDIHGSGVGLDIEVFEGAGSYVAGEETSLIHSMEGLRGEVAARPPYPTEHGLFSRPTVVNNVETLAAVPWIVARGGDAYAALGTTESPGTKLVCLNERFERPGVYEVELGVPIRHIVDELGGGLKDDRRLGSLQVGGPLGGFLSVDQLDVPFSFEALAEIDAALGHGSLIAVDDSIAGVDLLRHVFEFGVKESCGTCSPCRIGTKRSLEIAERIAARGVDEQDMTSLGKLMRTMEDGSLCAFGGSLPMPVRGILAAYATEFAGKAHS